MVLNLYNRDLRRSIGRQFAREIIKIRAVISINQNDGDYYDRWRNYRNISPNRILRNIQGTPRTGLKLERGNLDINITIKAYPKTNQ